MSSDDSVLHMYETMSYEESKDTFPLSKVWLHGKNPFQCFAGGKFECSNIRKDCSSEPIKDLCTNESVATFYLPVEDDVQAVLQSSSQGHKVWNGLDCHSRGELLSQITKKLEEKKDLLSEIEALTIGSTLFDAKREEVPRACAYFFNNSLMSHSVDDLEDYNNGVVLVTSSVPIPLFALSALTSTLLAAGCAVILNPQVQPLSAFALADLCCEAGLPPGVLNVIPGSLHSMAKDLIKESRVVTQILVWGTKMTNKQATIELGPLGIPIVPFYYGKAISIVFDSCDIQTTIDVLLKNMRFTKYQHPWSVRSLFVEESIFDRFVSALKQRLAKMRIGSARITGVEVGLPETDFDMDNNILNSARKEFAERGVEVYQPPATIPIFFPPTLIIGTDGETNSLVKDYDPLPFVSLIPFRGVKDVISFANKNHFGVAASVWTNCSPLALHVASNLQVGTVWINDHGTVDPSVPFANRNHGFGCIGGDPGLEQIKFGSGPVSQQMVSKSDEVKTGEVKQPITKEYSLHYGGTWRPSCGTSRFHLPSFQGGFHSFSDSNRSDVSKAVDAANTAFLAWKKLSGPTRASLLLTAAKKLRDCSQDFVRYFNKPEVDNSITMSNAIKSLYAWACKSKHLGEGSSSAVANCLIHTELSPLGVIAIVVDGSSDFGSLTSAMAAAVAHGNSVVTLMHHTNPAPALELCALLSSQRLPAGLVNALPTSTFDLCSEFITERNVRAVWYVGDCINLWSSLQTAANKASKLLWRFRDSTPSSVATHCKAIWMPCENGSC